MEWYSFHFEITFTQYKIQTPLKVEDFRMIQMDKWSCSFGGYAWNITVNTKLEIKLPVIGINLYTKDIHINFNISKVFVKCRCFVTTPFSSRSAKEDKILNPFPLFLFLYSVIFFQRPTSSYIDLCGPLLISPMGTFPLCYYLFFSPCNILFISNFSTGKYFLLNFRSLKPILFLSAQ